ncbi:acyl-CoA dehydrogenase family protein [Diaminobutyricimonas sp. TR449]|uniref:acyl-CoA dehydrogenase family protein n=1 Tax=Diaminobutyricimonas sp. TR449 TaxID=2708076 RepID=UPI001422CBE4|nr:acyl-CoA dehydrogenase family protein [Diaminobutyricimonas sp. TR449]
MSTVVEEVGTLVADNVREILESASGSPAAPNEKIWTVLAEGGWGTISADPDNGMELRDILEVARITGRFPYSTPIVSTLLAGRWFELDEEQLAIGVVPALRRGKDVVAPYYSEGVMVVDGSGSPVEAAPLSVESFSLLTPVAVLPDGTTEIDGSKLVEARAAYVAVAVGCADAVIEQSVAWAQTREQFGQPIKGFQAVRHHLANAHIAREQAWTAAIAAAHEPEASARWARQGFSLVRTAIELGIQVHGGVGFTWEVGIQHFLNQVIELDSILGEVR